MLGHTGGFRETIEVLEKKDLDATLFEIGKM